MAKKQQKALRSNGTLKISLGIVCLAMWFNACKNAEKNQNNQHTAECEPLNSDCHQLEAYLTSETSHRELPQQFSQCSLNNLRCMVHRYVSGVDTSETATDLPLRRHAAEYCLPEATELQDFPLLANQSGCIHIDRLDIPSHSPQDPLYSCRFPGFRGPLNQNPISSQSETLLRAMELTFMNCRSVVQAVKSDTDANDN